MVERRVTIQNKLGLHARPAAQFVKAAAKYKADVYVGRDDQEVNGKSIMGVMMLAAEMGSILTITIDGEDEKEAMETLVGLIDSKFDEE